MECSVGMGLVGVKASSGAVHGPDSEGGLKSSHRHQGMRTDE